MTRIAREPAESNPLADNAAWDAAGMEASSTFDVCAGCVEHYGLDDGEPWPELGRDLRDLAPYNGEPLDGDWVVVSPLEHPPYDDDPEGYSCAVCSNTLDPEVDD